MTQEQLLYEGIAALIGAACGLRWLYLEIRFSRLRDELEPRVPRSLKEFRGKHPPDLAPRSTPARRQG